MVGRPARMWSSLFLHSSNWNRQGHDKPRTYSMLLINMILFSLKDHNIYYYIHTQYVYVIFATLMENKFF